MVLKVKVNIFAVPKRQSIKMYGVEHSSETWEKQHRETRSSWVTSDNADLSSCPAGRVEEKYFGTCP